MDLHDIKLHQNLMFNHRYLMTQDSLFTVAAFVLRCFDQHINISTFVIAKTEG